MMRMISGVCVASVVSCAISLAAQAPSTATAQRAAVSDAAAHDITVTGCVAKSADGKFTLTNVVVEPPAAATTATGATSTAGTPPTGTATAGTAAAPATSPTSVGTTSAPRMWALSGGTDLDKHVGHKIQVMGRTTWDASMAGKPMTGTTTPGATTGTTGSATGATTASAAMAGPSVDVKTIKMLTASCP